VTAAVLDAPTPDAAPARRPAWRRPAVVAAMTALLGVLVVASLVLGTRVVGLDEVLAGLRGDLAGYGEAAVSARLPRTALAILVGAALAVSGASLQAVTRNPIADPGILGITYGSALVVVLGIVVLGISSPSAYIGAAVLGAGAAAFFVYLIGSLGPGGLTPLKLALAGAATSAAFVSLTSAILLPRVDVMATFRFWQVGGVGGATWDRVLLVLPVIAAGLILALALARGMNLLALGDEVAAGLGAHVGRTRLLAFVSAVVLAGAATAVAGPIAFVGLVVPHACRLLLGPDNRWVLPASAVLGACLLLISDVLGRIVARPAEIEVGIVTAVVGAPFFIWLVRRQKVRQL
jgi:iron complex transport system permease protein